MGLLTPTLCRFAHAGDGVVIEVLSINDALNLFTPVGDPVAGIGGQEEGHKHVNRAGVGGVLDEGGHVSVVVTTPKSYTIGTPCQPIQTLR